MHLLHSSLHFGVAISVAGRKTHGKCGTQHTSMDGLFQGISHGGLASQHCHKARRIPENLRLRLVVLSGLIINSILRAVTRNSMVLFSGRLAVR